MYGVTRLIWFELSHVKYLEYTIKVTKLILKEIDEYFVGTGDINNPAKINKEENKEEEKKTEDDLDVYKDEDVELYTMLNVSLYITILDL